jgi:hypothetical protein
MEILSEKWSHAALELCISAMDWCRGLAKLKTRENKQHPSPRVNPKQVRHGQNIETGKFEHFPGRAHLADEI